MLPQSGGSSTGYLITIVIVVAVVVLRNSQPRQLRIERLWILPAIYIAMLVSALVATPPPVTFASIGLLVLCFLVGAGLGWQRARLMQIHIHPETHALTSRASPIGIAFILAIVLARQAVPMLLRSHPGLIGVPIAAITDALMVLGIAMLATQRFEVWRRASAMLAEAQAAPGPPPPSSLVS